MHVVEDTTLEVGGGSGSGGGGGGGDAAFDTVLVPGDDPIIAPGASSSFTLEGAGLVEITSNALTQTITINVDPLDPPETYNEFGSIVVDPNTVVAPTPEAPVSFKAGPNMIISKTADAEITFEATVPAGSDTTHPLTEIPVGAGIGVPDASFVEFTYSDLLKRQTVYNLATRLTPVVDVRAFGAVGDGVTDDATAILAAIVAAPAQSVLYFPAGTYRFNSNIVATKPLVLMGDGPQKSILSGGAARSISITCDGATYPSWNNIGLKSLTVSGCTGVTIGQSGASVVRNLSVEDVEFTGLSGKVYLYGAEGRLSGCKFTSIALGAPGEAVKIEGSIWTVEGNIFSSCSNVTNWLLCLYPAGLVVHGNAFLGTPFSNSIFLSAVTSSSVRIIANQFTLDGNNGIYATATDLSLVTIAANTFDGDSAGYGIDLHDCNHVTITGNTMAGSSFFGGIQLVGGANAIVTGNYFGGCTTVIVVGLGQTGVKCWSNYKGAGGTTISGSSTDNGWTNLGPHTNPTAGAVNQYIACDINGATYWVPLHLAG